MFVLTSLAGFILAGFILAGLILAGLILAGLILYGLFDRYYLAGLFSLRYLQLGSLLGGFFFSV